MCLFFHHFDKFSILFQCEVEEPRLPYYDVVPSDPSHQEMYQAVCVKKIRPDQPERWAHRYGPIRAPIVKLLTNESNGITGQSEHR
jgi:hypothetical protein